MSRNDRDSPETRHHAEDPFRKYSNGLINSLREIVHQVSVEGFDCGISIMYTLYRFVQSLLQRLLVPFGASL